MKKEKIITSFLLKAKSYKLKAAFTLVEMIVAVGIFAVIMVISVGSLVSLIEANHKAQALKTVVNNLHFALENMSRNIRTGNNYHCGAGQVDIARDCANDPESQLVFKGRDGDYILYQLSGGAIMRSKNKNVGSLLVSTNLVPITAPEIILDQLRFYVDGTGSNDHKQPRVLIVLKGSMKGKSKIPARFDIETLVSQRLLDI